MSTVDHSESVHTLSTRIATTKDIPTLAMLFNAYRQFYQQADDLTLATSFIGARIEKGESIVIIAEGAAREMLGFCQLYPTFCSVAAAPIYALYDLFVRPDARNCGAGRILLLAAEQLAIENQIVRMDLTTAKTNLTAQGLYESLGWVRDEVFFAYNKSIKM